MYSAEISRANPTCFVFLLDQSRSMEDRIGGEDGAQSKEDVVADAINRLLQELAIKCAKEEGVRDYFYVSVIGCMFFPWGLAQSGQGAAAYLDRREEDNVRHRKSESLAIPENLDFASLGGLSNEMKAKFLAVRPGSLGEAARIEGITPTALALVAGHVRSGRVRASDT